MLPKFLRYDFRNCERAASQMFCIGWPNFTFGVILLITSTVVPFYPFLNDELRRLVRPQAVLERAGKPIKVVGPEVVTAQKLIGQPCRVTLQV
jgi:hypothetical protein